MSDVVPVITIDGPSGTGKGTICHQLARHLGWHFLDSGALYRIVAFAAEQSGIALDDIEGLVELIPTLDIRFELDANWNSLVFWNANNISLDIRTEACGQNASKIAAIPEVRAALLARQRVFAQWPGLVTDGRDMGTVVFPNALLKIYLYASVEERAARRHLQLKEVGNNASLAQVMDELAKRDARDTERACAPLKPAQDAVLVDTTDLSVVQVFNNVLQLAQARLLRK